MLSKRNQRKQALARKVVNLIRKRFSFEFGWRIVSLLGKEAPANRTKRTPEMNREMTITPIRTYATAANVRKAIAKTGDEGVRHMILQEEGGRFYALFRPTEAEMTETGIHFRWNCI